MEINQIRQGDIPLFRSSIPSDATVVKDGKVAEGEGVGHLHRIIDAEVFEKNGRMYVRAREGSKIMHTKQMTDSRAEHYAIPIPPGEWEVAREQDFDPYKKAWEDAQD